MTEVLVALGALQILGEAAINNCKTSKELELVRNALFGKQGILTQIDRDLKMANKRDYMNVS